MTKYYLIIPIFIIFFLASCGNFLNSDKEIYCEVKIYDSLNLDGGTVTLKFINTDLDEISSKKAVIRKSREITKYSYTIILILEDMDIYKDYIDTITVKRNDLKSLEFNLKLTPKKVADLEKEIEINLDKTKAIIEQLKNIRDTLSSTHPAKSYIDRLISETENQIEDLNETFQKLKKKFNIIKPKIQIPELVTEMEDLSTNVKKAYSIAILNKNYMRESVDISILTLDSRFIWEKGKYLIKDLQNESLLKLDLITKKQKNFIANNNQLKRLSNNKIDINIVITSSADLQGNPESLINVYNTARNNIIYNYNGKINDLNNIGNKGNYYLSLLRANSIMKEIMSDFLNKGYNINIEINPLGCEYATELNGKKNNPNDRYAKIEFWIKPSDL